MWRFGCGVVLCGALVGGLATSAYADDAAAADPGSVLVGGFSVGDGLEAMIEEREGALRFQLPIGGLTATWDSRRVADNRSGLGPGWGWSIGAIDTEGGVRVFPAAGGVYEADDSVTSGLRGYEVGDIAFEQREGVLPAREGVADARPYSFVLAELGGVTTYFSAAGDPLASIDAVGDRKDWIWGAAHRLTATVDGHGVRTDLVWNDDTNSLVVRRATNVGSEPPAEWRVQLGLSGVESVADPLAQTTTVAYTDSGLVASITGVSGSSTEVAWHSADDGVARVDEITTVDPERAVLSSRTWEASSALPTGWPATSQPGGSSFETVLSDGPSRVVSSYSALGLLTHRELQVSTASGSNVVQTTDFTYPDLGGSNPTERPGNWSRPTSTEITYLNASGGSRSVTESSVFDDFGRVVGTERARADRAEPEAGSATFDGLGRMTFATDGVTESRIEHDEFGRQSTRRISAVSSVARGGTAPAADGALTASLAFDAFGRSTRRVDTTRDAIDAPAVSTSTEYVYDSLQRLVGSTVRGGHAADAPIARETEYELSLAGDILREIVRTDPGSETESTTTRSFGYSARSELATITTETADGTTVAQQTYDAKGNLMAAADGGSYVFDAADRPIAHTAADGTVTETEYWADGSRKLQRSGDETTTFHWDGESLLTETVDAAQGAGVASYLIGASRHARTILTATVEGAQPDAPATSYFGTDRHGNVTDLTDRNGVVTTRYAYTDYGTTTRTPVGGDRPERGIARNPFQYAGEHTDRTGTQHLATRSYDDATMRFINMDKAPLENRFAFGDLNPIMNVDPSGRSAIPDVVSWTVAAIGTIAALASLAGAIYAASIAAHGLTVMSVTAVAANAGAAGAATAVAVDANIKDFMDDETADLVSYGEFVLPIGLTLAAAALDTLAQKAAAHLAKKAATTVKNPFPKTPLFTKKYSNEWATTRDGQKAWQKLQKMVEAERDLRPTYRKDVWDDWYRGLRENPLHQRLFTETGPTKESDQLLDWLIEAEWKATVDKNSTRLADDLEFFRASKKALIDAGSPQKHAAHHKFMGTPYMTRDQWNARLNNKAPKPQLNIGASYDLG